MVETTLLHPRMDLRRVRGGAPPRPAPAEDDRLAGRLTIEHLERAWDVIDRFHAAGMFIGDAKVANFLMTEMAI